MKILATGTGNIYVYKNYVSMLVQNNDYHNSTNCITIDRFHPNYRKLAVKFWKYSMKKVYKHVNGIDGVCDVVETDKSQSVGKYFIIMD